MRRVNCILVFLLVPLTLSLFPITSVHAATFQPRGLQSSIAIQEEASGGFQSISAVFYSSGNESNGNMIYDTIVTVNWSGPLTGTSTSYERDVVYSNGTVADLGTGVFVGSFEGEPAGSMIDHYNGSFTDVNAKNVFRNATLNDSETFSGGNYGLTGLQVQVTDQAALTSCNSQQTSLNQETVCSGTGTYVVRSSVLVATP